MRILAVILCAVFAVGLYFVIAWRQHAQATVSAASVHATSSSSVPTVARDGVDRLAGLEARLDALEALLAQWRERGSDATLPARTEPRAQQLSEAEFRRVYRETIVKIIAEERERPSFGDRAELLAGSVRRYLISNRLESDPHAGDWQRLLEDTRARADRLRAEQAPDLEDGAPARAGWKSAWTALRADAYAKLATTLAARHVDVLLDLVFNF